MGNIEDFAAALAGEDFQKQLAAENPYFNLRQAPDLVGAQIIPMLAKNPGKYSTSQALALALGSGLTSGLLGGLGENYQTEKTNQYQQTINDMAFGRPVDSSALPPSIFRKAQDSVNLFKTRKALEDVQKQSDFDLKLRQEIEAAQNPDLIAAERNKILSTELSPEISRAKANQAAMIEAARESAGASRRPGSRMLQDSEKDAWGSILNLTPEEKSTLRNVDDVDRIRLAKGSQGEKVRPPSEKELTLLTSNDNFKARIQDIKRLVEQTDESSVRRAIKGGKVFSLLADTDSPAYQLYTALGTAKQQFAKATLGSQISDFDVRTWQPAFEGIPLLDSKQALLNRLTDIEKNLDRSKLNTLNNMRKGYANIDRFEEDRRKAEDSLASASQMPDLASFIAEAKARGLSKEQAKAAWIALGGE